MGGHYYAYILDKETKQWLNFDDIRVNKIDILDVTEMYGGVQGAGRFKSSTANAYMLMYRLSSQDQDQEQEHIEIPQ